MSANSLNRKYLESDFLRCSIGHEHLAPQESIYLCHHCRKMLCNRHAIADQESFEFLGSESSSLSARLGLKKSISAFSSFNDDAGIPIHCEDCAHPKKSYLSYVVIGLILTVVGLITLYFHTLPGLVLTLCGLVLAAGSARAHYTSFFDRNQVLRTVPLNPDFDVMSEEVVTGDFIFDAATCKAGDRVSPEGVVRNVSSQGQLNIFIQINHNDLETKNEFYKKYDLDPEEQASVPFLLGYFLVNDYRNLEFKDPNFSLGQERKILPLKINLPQFNRANDPQTGERQPVVVPMPYKVTSWGADQLSLTTNFPITILPLMEKQTANTLIILLLIDHRLPVHTRNMEIKNFSLKIPAGIEVTKSTLELQGTEWEGRFHPKGKDRRLEWSSIKVPPEQWHLRFTITFDQPLLGSLKSTKPVPNLEAFTGSYELKCHSPISHPANETAGSQTPRIRFFSPAGHNREVNSISALTTLKGNFTINPEVLSYSEEYTLSAPPMIFSTLFPDHNTVNKLVEELSKSEIFVAKVIKNAPTTSAKSSQIKNWNWDIQCKRYEDDKSKLFGIDVHILLKGEEHYADGVKPYKGNSEVSITVRGLVHEPQVKKLVEDFNEKLLKTVENSLKQYAAEHPLLNQAPAEPPGTPYEVHTPGGFSAPGTPKPFVETSKTQSGEFPPVDSGPRTVRTESSKITELKKKLALLEERLLAKEIGEAAFLSIYKRIQQEITDLEKGSIA